MQLSRNAEGMTRGHRPARFPLFPLRKDAFGATFAEQKDCDGFGTKPSSAT